MDTIIIKKTLFCCYGYYYNEFNIVIVDVVIKNNAF